MKFPPSATSAVVLGALRLLRATWRFHRVGPPPDSREDSDGRQGEDRDRAPRSARRAGPLPPAIYVCWHEHQLPLAIFHARQGVVALTSRHRDGETVAKVLHRLGYRTARGSSSRGGAAGLRQMVRNGRQGRSLAFTPDGPRGPPRRCKPGTIVAAAMTGLPIVPVGVAVTRGWRLSSWDRFLIPAPGSSIFVSYGPALRVPPRAAREPDEWTPRLQEAIEREVRRCEREVRRPDGQARESTGLSEAESRLRAAWRKGPRPLLRAAGVLFGVGSELRHFAYDVGLIETRRPPIPDPDIIGVNALRSEKEVFLDVRLDPAGAERLRTTTAENIGRSMVIMFDSRIVSAPTIFGEIGSSPRLQMAVPAGSAEEADDIVALVRARWPSENESVDG